MIEQARGRVVVVADHSKIGTVADFVIAPLEAADTLIVDDAVDEEYRDRIVEAGVDVIVARAMVGSGSRSG